jgi:hypothetical protein
MSCVISLELLDLAAICVIGNKEKKLWHMLCDKNLTAQLF